MATKLTNNENLWGMELVIDCLCKELFGVGCFYLISPKEITTLCVFVRNPYRFLLMSVIIIKTSYTVLFRHVMQLLQCTDHCTHRESCA